MTTRREAHDAHEKTDSRIEAARCIEPLDEVLTTLLPRPNNYPPEAIWTLLVPKAPPGLPSSSGF